MLYIFSKIFLGLILPVVSIGAEVILGVNILNIETVGKWFIFWGMGVASFAAGIKQTLDPAFTLEKIFLITSQDCYVIVRELGFANISMGLVGMISLFIPSWRMPAAFVSCVFLGLAGIMHIIKWPVTLNEHIALIYDILASIMAVVYIIKAK